MFDAPVLVVGGYGAVGQMATRYFREANPSAPILIGGRTLRRAEDWAAELGNAEGVVVDLSQQNLGLGERDINAVAILIRDDRLAGLSFARARGIPHVSIASAVEEMGLEAASFMYAPQKAVVVLGTEWLVGAAIIPALSIIRSFARVDRVRIGAILDEEDTGGPAQVADLTELTAGVQAALTRRGGVFSYRDGKEARTTFRAIDGTQMEAVGISVCDVIALSTATGAPNVEFNLATGITSSRRRGQAKSTEIIIEVEGIDRDGSTRQTRHAVVHWQGQFPLTGLGVALVLERVVGLRGRPATRPGLYFPHQIIDHDEYFERFEAIGGQILDLKVDDT